MVPSGVCTSGAACGTGIVAQGCADRQAGPVRTLVLAEQEAGK
jgi:hypothetical protein